MLCKGRVFLSCRNVHFRGFKVLPQEMGCPVRAQVHLWHSTTASIAAVIFYCHWKSGTTALRAVLPPGRYYRTVASRWGLRAGQGEFQLPHTDSTHFPHAVSLSPAQERRRRTSPDLHLRPLSSDSVRWDRSPPLPLAMDQGLSANPSLFVRAFASWFWGDACCS